MSTQTIFGSEPIPRTFPEATPTPQSNCAGCGLVIGFWPHGGSFKGIVWQGKTWHIEHLSPGDRLAYEDAQKATKIRKDQENQQRAQVDRQARHTLLHGQLDLVKSAEGKAMIARLGFPYAFALEFAQQNVAFSEGKILNAPRLEFSTSYSGRKTSSTDHR